MNRYHVFSYLFALFLGFSLHIAGQTFFTPLTLSLESLFLKLISGIGIILIFPILYVGRNILENEQDKLKDFENLKEDLGHRVGNFVDEEGFVPFDVGKRALQGIDTSDKAWRVMKGTIYFLILGLILIHFLDSSSIKSAFRGIFSAAGFGYVLYIIIRAN